MRQADTAKAALAHNYIFIDTGIVTRNMTAYHAVRFQIDDLIKYIDQFTACFRISEIERVMRQYNDYLCPFFSHHRNVLAGTFD